MSHPVASDEVATSRRTENTGGRGSLFGGAGLAAGIVALEQATEKPARLGDRAISVDHPATAHSRH